MIESLQPFIDRGYWTVPLEGQLVRDAKGKKSIPVFQANWRERHSRERSTKDSVLGGLLTGIHSGFVAIDCDSTVVSNLFRSLDPDYPVVFAGVGKMDAAGEPIDSLTILYQYEQDVATTYKRADSAVQLDYYADNGFIYAATSANKTKVPLTAETLDLLKPMPSAVKALVLALKPTQSTASMLTQATKTWTLHLQPQVQNMVLTQQLNKPLFKVITPKDFRDLPTYVANGWLHPDDVPEGRGSEYLSKVSAILGADCSIDEELYLQAMSFVNSSFSTPMATRQFEATITDPMVEARSNADGVVIWQYDEAWQSSRLSLVTKRKELIEAFYDPARMLYYLINPVAAKHIKFDRFDVMYQHIESIALSTPKKPAVKLALPLVDVGADPSRDYGFFGAEDVAFNTFNPTPALSVLRNPTVYASRYSRPHNTIKYLETLIPCPTMRRYILGFLKRKFSRFEYSPVVIYLIGASGSGKDTLFKLIQRIMGEASTSAPSAKGFLEVYNGYMLDTYFVQLDEYGNQLTRYEDKELALGKLKAYTGKQSIDVRLMRTDSFSYNHNVTFIMTANKNPLTFDHDDRRVAYCNTPNKLGEAEWVAEAGGLATVMAAMESETVDFCYWLATQVDELTLDEYMEPPATQEKRLLLASMYSAGQRMAYLLHHGMFTEFQAEATLYGYTGILKYADLGIVYEHDLLELYLELTDDAGTKRGLSKAFIAFAKSATTHKGAKSFKYTIPQLQNWYRDEQRLIAISGDFDEV